MDADKRIEVKQSALSSLKSELIRKKEAALLSKADIADIPRKKLKPLNRAPSSNDTVSNSLLRSSSNDAEDYELLRKSRKCLEDKTRLYEEKRNAAGCGHVEVDDECLVNFRQKTAEEQSDKIEGVLPGTNNESFIVDSCNDYGDDSDWVEYVDFLGRTRKCLKEDLEKMKKIDDEFLRTVSREADPDIPAIGVPLTSQVSERPDFLQRLHEQWEEQEQQLKDKQNIHYQDVFFNEARAHGVGYYAFSTDERARVTQQTALERLRQETRALQEAAKQRAAQTLAQSTARVDAAKKRMLRLLQAAVGAGELTAPTKSDVAASILSPVQAAMDATQKNVLARRTEHVESLTKEKETEAAVLHSSEVESDLGEDDIKRKSHIRPWDEGKDGIISEQHKGYVRPQEREVMSQEKWIEKKREERLEEFAPILEPDKAGVNVVEERSPAAPKNTLFFSSRKETVLNSCPSRTKLINKFQSDCGRAIVEAGSDDAINIAPRIENVADAASHIDPYADMSPTEISEAVEAGLKYLRQKADEKEAKLERRFLSFT